MFLLRKPPKNITFCIDCLFFKSISEEISKYVQVKVEYGAKVHLFQLKR